jgi:hypothetical protein
MKINTYSPSLVISGELNIPSGVSLILSMAPNPEGEYIDKENLESLKDLVLVGLQCDGSHHKQWYLEQIAVLIGCTELPDHEEGVAP